MLAFQALWETWIEKEAGFPYAINKIHLVVTHVNIAAARKRSYSWTDLKLIRLSLRDSKARSIFTMLS